MALVWFLIHSFSLNLFYECEAFLPVFGWGHQDKFQSVVLIWHCNKESWTQSQYSSCHLVRCEAGEGSRQSGQGCCPGFGSSAGWGRRGRASSLNWPWGKDSLYISHTNSLLWLEPQNSNDATRLQMGDGVHECDALFPEPAVVRWPHIFGRRDVRVPEIANACRTLKEQSSTSSCNPPAGSLSVTVLLKCERVSKPNHPDLRLNFFRTEPQDCTSTKPTPEQTSCYFN